MKRLFTFLGVATVLVWFALMLLLLFVSGLHPFNATIAGPTATPTPYKSGQVQVNGLFQGWYHIGNCVYIEQDTGCDIDG